MSQMPQASHRSLLVLSQPWFSAACHSCDELEKIKLNNGVAGICRLVEQGKTCKKKVNALNLEQFMQSMAEKFASLDEANRIFALSALDREFSSYLQGKNLVEAKQLLTDVALEVGEGKVQDLRTLFKEKLSKELPDLQRILITDLLKRL